MNFTILDWAIVSGYLVVSLAVGLLGKKYIGNVAHYLVAGRELGVYIGIATLAAAEIGTITFMYNAELGYRCGFAAFAAAQLGRQPYTAAQFLPKYSEHSVRRRPRARTAAVSWVFSFSGN